MSRKRDDFANLHVHSHFSTLDGLSTPQEIVQRVVDLGQKHIAITDHGSMSGIPQMYQAAREADISFTPGCEMYFATDQTLKAPDKIGEKYYHLIMLAYNNEGYTNLSKLQTIAWNEGYYYKPRIDYSALEKHHKGLTVTTSCLGGIVNQYLLRDDIASAEAELAKFVDIFGKENTYVELQNHGIDEQLKILGAQRDLARRFGLKMIATTDSHYCTQCESDVHDSLLCTGTKAKKTDANRFKFESDQNFLHSGKQMLDLFPHEEFPGAISNTVELAEKTEFTMNMGKNKKYLMPITGTGNKTDDEFLYERVMEGASDPMRYGDENGDIPDEVRERIDYELSVIKKMRFSSYFLIVQNIITTLAKHNIIIGPGRGCLHPATPILTPGGWLPISAIGTGDMVLTENGSWGEVADIKCHEVYDGEPLVTLTTSAGESLTTTTKHKILVSDDNGEEQWMSASQVEIGTHSIVSVDEEGNRAEHRVINREVDPSDVDVVYDLSLYADFHPSFMTNAGIVHNSAPGSVVVYCLGIVDVDPLEHGLLFERFLNPDRVSMPDIDIDIPKSKRKEALEIVEREYGEGHVAHLSNYNKMGMRDALLRAAKVYGMEPSAANKFRDIIATWCEEHGESLDDFSNRGLPPTEVEKKLPPTPHYATIVSTAAKFIGRVMGNGVHASGVLITDSPLDDNFPLRAAKNNPLPVCQYDGTDTEAIGGVKFDLLGLINLDECEDTERNILYDLGEKVDSSHIPHDDPEVYQLLSSGEGGGVFQLGCVAGDTIVDGRRIDLLYRLRNSSLATSTVRSVFLGKGRVDDHTKKSIVYSGIKGTVTISTKSGHRLTCTPEHHLWTQRGWVKAGDLIIGEDSVMTVPDGTYSLDGVRGLEDVIDLFLESHPGWERYEGKAPITIGEKSHFPHVVSPGWDRYAYFYPDENYHTGVKDEHYSYSFLNEDGERIIEVMSYTQVIEDYAPMQEEHLRLLSPVGCTMSTVVSCIDAGEQPTYDIMMDYPINNFIANGIVTHNSSGIQALLRHMKPTEFKNIPATLALYRPGPMGMGTHNEYCERKNGTSPLDVLHHDMEEVVKDNYNLIIYQEDIMHLARLMAGYTGGEADDLRKAMAKKNPEMMEKHHKKFVPAVNERYGNNLGQKLWDIIEPFGAYAFNSCLHGDTKVVSVEHGSISVQELSSMDFHGMEILSMDKDGMIVPHRINNVVATGHKPVYTVRTSSGKEISITAEHRMLTTDGYGTIEDGSIRVGAHLVSEDSCRSPQSASSTPGSYPDVPHSSQWELDFSIKLSNGMGVETIAEAKVGEYLISLGYGSSMSIEISDGEEGVSHCHYLVDGLSIVVSDTPFDRHGDSHYSDSSNVIVVTPYDYIEVINDALLTPKGCSGEEIVEIIPPQPTLDGSLSAVETYDIEMMSDGPSNFLANGLVSHNSHSVAYGYITYRTAWLKAHYPAQFSGAVIDQRMNNHDEIFETISWIKKMGVKVHAPDIQHSEMRSVTDEDSIYLPLHIIKGLGEKKSREIIEERERGGEFTSIVDAVSRCKMSASMVENIAKAGGFDGFNVNRARVVESAEDIVAMSKSHSSMLDMRNGLFGSMVESTFQDDSLDLTTPVEYAEVGGVYLPVNQAMLGRWERDTMGVLLGEHPFASVRNSKKAAALMRKYPPIDTYEHPSENADFSGYIHNIVNRTSSRGNPFSSFVLETDRGIVPGLKFQAHINEENEGAFVAVSGKIINDSDDGSSEDFTPKAMCTTIRKVDVSKILDNSEGEQ